MREKKEFHRYNLPHFQQPGQAYFVTWCLKDAVPPKAFLSYTLQLEALKNRISFQKEDKSSDGYLRNLEQEYQAVQRKYIKAYNDLLDAEQHPSVNLSKAGNTQIIIGALQFWESRKLENIAYCIMRNHVHWVFKTFKQDDKGKPVYLEDIMQSIKRYSANRINKLENRQGSLWQKESFDTTIRNDRHLYNAINYTLNNPVSVGLVADWKLWPGSYGRSDF